MNSPPWRDSSTTEVAQSPLERFSAQHLGSSEQQYLRYKKPLGHRALLKRAALHVNLSPKRIGAITVLRSSGQVVGGFDGAVTTLVSAQAQELSGSRALARHYLQADAATLGTGTTFTTTEAQDALQHFRNQPGAVNLHAGSGPGHSAQILGVQEESDFRDAWDTVARACSKAPADQRVIEVSPYKAWVPLRLFVIGEEVMGSVARIPLSVTGDGETTAGQLADQEIRRRAEYPNLAERGPQITDEFLRPRGISRAWVPSAGQTVLLSTSSDTREGWALPVDVHRHVSEQLKTLAINALWSVPGLRAGAVDLLAPSPEATEGEIDSIRPDADLRDFIYPALGRRRYIHLALMRHIAGNAAQLRRAEPKLSAASPL